MVNPGAFQGARKAFLMGEKDTYSQAVDEGYVAEAVAKIQRRFFKRFPIDLPEDTEPTPEELAAIDDEAIEPEYPEPDPEKMTAEEYAAAKEDLGSRQRKIAFRKGQIKRWLAYQYMKDHDVDSKASGAQNPYRVLLFKLTGKEFIRPRAKTACNVWHKTQRAEIEEKVKVIAAAKSIGKSGLVTLRDKVAKEMYSQLPAEERRKWQSMADEESNAAQKLWDQEVSGPPSKAPEDRQRCILGLVRFVQPILDLVCEATGWKASFIAGGPEPAHGGRLNIISVHSGKTAGDIALDFGALEREGYKKHFVPMYGRFLKRCYSVEECHARALAPEDSLSLEAAGLEGESANLFTLDVTSGGFDGGSVASSSPQEPLATTAPKGQQDSAAELTFPPSDSTRPPQEDLARSSRASSMPPSPPRSPPRSPPPSPPASPRPAEPSSSADSSILQSTRHSKRRLSISQTAEVDTGPQPPKKRKTARQSKAASTLDRSEASDTRTAPIAADLDAPTWFSSALLMLQGRGLEENNQWMGLVRKWVAFEEQEGYEEIARLPSAFRPKAIASWIQRKRSATYQPKIDLTQYSKAYMNWWTAMQPDWRVSDKKIDFNKVEGDWEELKKPGLNGLVSVLVGLFYWGCAVKEGENGSGEWEMAVKDCFVALTYLTASAA